MNEKIIYKNMVWNNINEMLNEYRVQIQDQKIDVCQKIEMNHLIELFHLSSHNSDEEEDLYEDIKKYLKYSIRTSHSHFCNQLFAPLDMWASVGEVVAMHGNTSMSTQEISPVATALELKLIKRLGELIGYGADVKGTMVPGGSYANMMSLVFALEKINPNIKEEGLSSIGNPLVAFVSDQAHYSFLKGMTFTGLGKKNLWKVPSDKHGQMDVVELERLINKSLDEGEKPFFIGATSGTTVRGSFDPLREISIIGKKYNLWVHVDGAYGGPFIFSEKYKSKLEGVELTNSFSWDAHKILGAPLPCTLFVTNENGSFEQATKGGGEEYLFHNQDNEKSFDLGVHSFQCGRKVDSLKLWLLWKSKKESGMGQEVEKLVSKAQYAQNIVLKSDQLELIFPLESLNLCFRYCPKNTQLTQEQLNLINKLTRQLLLETGRFMVNSSWDNGTFFIRWPFIQRNLTLMEIDQFFDLFIKTAKSIP